MNWRGRSVMAAAALALTTTPGLAADVKALPYWTSDQVRAARSLEPSQALVFDIQETDFGSPGPPKAQSETVTLAPSFIYVAGPDDNVVEDRSLCRSLSWSTQRRLLRNDSCFAGAALRAYEIANRDLLAKMLRGALKADSAHNPLSDAYWNEAELGVEREAHEPLQRRALADGAEYDLGRRPVIRISGVSSAITPEETQRFVRFLALRSHLHPQARHDLANTGSLPRSLQFQVHGPKGEAEWDSMVISNVRRVQVAYPLPSGLASELGEEIARADSPRTRALHEVALAIEGRSTIVKPRAQDLVAAMTAAVRSRHMIEGLFDFLGLSQQYGIWLATGAGQSALPEVKADLAAIFADDAAARFMNVTNLAGGEGGKSAADREAAARYLATVNLDGLPFATFRYLTFANLVAGSGDTSRWDPAIFKAMPSPLVDNYWVHIAAYPWASNAYKDVGDYYLRGYQTPDAWIAYDLGRAVDPDWRQTPTPPNASAVAPIYTVSGLEDQLRSDFPDFF